MEAAGTAAPQTKLGYQQQEGREPRLTGPQAESPTVKDLLKMLEPAPTLAPFKWNAE
jgi:hypothetical protein